MKHFVDNGCNEEGQRSSLILMNVMEIILSLHHTEENKVHAIDIDLYLMNRVH